MLVQFCDRCGRTTDNKTAFLIPCSKEVGSYQVNGTWFGDPVVLCNHCIKEFDFFRYNHKAYNRDLVNDKDES